MTDSPPANPIEALLRLPGTIVSEVGAAIPRLADRTKAQVDFAATLLEKLRCGDLGSRLSSLSPTVPDHVADVVPFEPRIGAATPDAPVREPIEVVTVDRAPAPTAPAAKVPARTAAAKKSSAKKAAAKKAPAKKAPAKKSPAKKSPAKKSPAKKSPARKASAVKAPAPVLTDAVPDASTLAIPGYDALAASQVVPRLAALSPADLEAVRRYEAAGRGRRTILSLIAQLQAG